LANDFVVESNDRENEGEFGREERFEEVSDTSKKELDDDSDGEEIDIRDYIFKKRKGQFGEILESKDKK